MTSNTATSSIRDATRLPLLWFAPCVVFLLGHSSPAQALVNFADFSALAANWQQSGCTSANNWCGGVDYDISGAVDVNDLMLFSETWLASKDHVLSDDVAALVIHLNPSRSWTYDRAFMVRSLYEKWKVCHNPVYLKWVKDWLGPQIAADGTILGYNQLDYNLDMIQPGRLLLAMYRHFGDGKYKLAADKLLVQLNNHPVTFDGGFWHKQKYPRQMWLDGIYMAETFTAEYAAMFNAPAWGDEAAFQITLIASHTQDTLIYPADPTRTGLMYHGWDASAFTTPPYTPKVWADPAKGHSPEFWGRAMGWYAMAIVDCLDYLPADHPQRSDIIAIFNTLAAGLAAYQDPNDGPDTNNGMWWQVVNKGYPRSTYPTNYTESSCTGMFSYAIGKAVEKGYIASDPNYYLAVSRAGLEGLRDYKVSYDVSGGWLRLKDTVQVGSLDGNGDYAYYMSIARPDNDVKGVGALMLAALQYEKTTMSPNASPSVVYQAEDADFAGQGTVDTNWSGYTGTGFVNVTNAVGSYIEWTVDAPVAGIYTLAIRFANGTTSARTAEIKINGSVAVASLSFGPTGAWTTWATVNTDATLQAGPNTFRATSLLPDGGPNYDKLEVIAFPAYIP